MVTKSRSSFEASSAFRITQTSIILLICCTDHRASEASSFTLLQKMSHILTASASVISETSGTRVTAGRWKDCATTSFAKYLNIYPAAYSTILPTIRASSIMVYMNIKVPWYIWNMILLWISKQGFFRIFFNNSSFSTFW